MTTKVKMSVPAHRLMCRIAKRVRRGRYEAETLAHAASDEMDGAYEPSDPEVRDAVAAGLIEPVPVPRNERNGISPVTWHLTGLGCKLVRGAKVVKPDPSHRWREPDKPQTRCRLCGAYRHLGSGFDPCPDAAGRFVVQGWAGIIGWSDSKAGADGTGLSYDDAVAAAAALMVDDLAWFHCPPSTRKVRVVRFADRRAAAMAAGTDARMYHRSTEHSSVYELQSQGAT